MRNSTRSSMNIPWISHRKFLWISSEMFYRKSIHMEYVKSHVSSSVSSHGEPESMTCHAIPHANYHRTMRHRIGNPMKYLMECSVARYVYIYDESNEILCRKPSATFSWLSQSKPRKDPSGCPMINTKALRKRIWMQNTLMYPCKILWLSLFNHGKSSGTCSSIVARRFSQIFPRIFHAVSQAIWTGNALRYLMEYSAEYLMKCRMRISRDVA